ncbi:hypothetical protein EXIGLDRAFT_707365 [Exidia glandulosa HHB12029]|uniref:Uncharacterized protein n=1 Tax=Exidia glandulosa HHB12029 TaxID=1314781 RepID=A0A166AUS1_EXIGL|nr:hypothetical protein EXIGLDRAFT_707365 [Exidia glandulosa HHB12029]
MWTLFVPRATVMPGMDPATASASGRADSPEGDFVEQLRREQALKPGFDVDPGKEFDWRDPPSQYQKDEPLYHDPYIASYLLPLQNDPKQREELWRLERGFRRWKNTHPPDHPPNTQARVNEELMKQPYARGERTYHDMKAITATLQKRFYDSMSQRVPRLHLLRPTEPQPVLPKPPPAYVDWWNQACRDFSKVESVTPFSIFPPPNERHRSFEANVLHIAGQFDRWLKDADVFISACWEDYRAIEKDLTDAEKLNLGVDDANPSAIAPHILDGRARNMPRGIPLLFSAVDHDRSAPALRALGAPVDVASVRHDATAPKLSRHFYIKAYAELPVATARVWAKAIERFPEGDEHRLQPFSPNEVPTLLVVSNVEFLPPIPPDEYPTRRADGTFGPHEESRFPQWHAWHRWHMAFIPSHESGDSMRRLHKMLDRDMEWYIPQINHFHEMNSDRDANDRYIPADELRRALQKRWDQVVSRFVQSFFHVRNPAGIPTDVRERGAQALAYLLNYELTWRDMIEALVSVQRSMLELLGWVAFVKAQQKQLEHDSKGHTISYAADTKDGWTWARGVFTTDEEVAKRIAQFRVPVWLFVSYDVHHRIDDQWKKLRPIKPKYDTRRWADQRAAAWMGSYAENLYQYQPPEAVLSSLESTDDFFPLLAPAPAPDLPAASTAKFRPVIVKHHDRHLHEVTTVTTNRRSTTASMTSPTTIRPPLVPYQAMDVDELPAEGGPWAAALEEGEVPDEPSSGPTLQAATVFGTSASQGKGTGLKRKRASPNQIDLGIFSSRAPGASIGGLKKKPKGPEKSLLVKPRNHPTFVWAAGGPPSWYLDPPNWLASHVKVDKTMTRMHLLANTPHFRVPQDLRKTPATFRMPVPQHLGNATNHGNTSQMFATLCDFMADWVHLLGSRPVDDVQGFSSANWKSILKGLAEQSTTDMIAQQLGLVRRLESAPQVTTVVEDDEQNGLARLAATLSPPAVMPAPVPSSPTISPTLTTLSSLPTTVPTSRATTPTGEEEDDDPYDEGGTDRPYHFGETDWNDSIVLRKPREDERPLAREKERYLYEPPTWRKKGLRQRRANKEFRWYIQVTPDCDMPTDAIVIVPRGQDGLADDRITHDEWWCYDKRMIILFETSQDPAGDRALDERLTRPISVCDYNGAKKQILRDTCDLRIWKARDFEERLDIPLEPEGPIGCRTTTCRFLFEPKFDVVLQLFPTMAPFYDATGTWNRPFKPSTPTPSPSTSTIPSASRATSAALSSTTLPLPSSPALVASKPQHKFKTLRDYYALSGARSINGHVLPPYEPFGDLTQYEWPPTPWKRYILWFTIELSFRYELYALDSLLRRTYGIAPHMSNLQRQQAICSIWAFDQRVETLSFVPSESNPLVSLDWHSRCTAILRFYQIVRSWPRVTQLPISLPASPPQLINATAFAAVERGVWQAYTQVYFDYFARDAPLPLPRPLLPSP